MAKSDSSLVKAATAFDEELAVYSRLGELFLKTPLNTLKHLERANQTLQELADSEQRLQAAGKQLIEALTAARQVQETLSQQVIDAAPALKDRNVKLGELKAAMGKLAADVGNLNTVVSGSNGDSGGEPAKPDPGEVSAIVLGLSDRAQELATACREAEFSELADDAHALYQRLKAVGTKLQKAGGN